MIFSAWPILSDMMWRTEWEVCCNWHSRTILQMQILIIARSFCSAEAIRYPITNTPITRTCRYLDSVLKNIHQLLKWWDISGSKKLDFVEVSLHRIGCVMYVFINLSIANVKNLSIYLLQTCPVSARKQQQHRLYLRPAHDSGGRQRQWWVQCDII